MRLDGNFMKDIHLKDIKKNQIFYERDCGLMAKFVTLEDSYESGNTKHEGKVLRQWKCKARPYDAVAGIDDAVIDFMTTENCEHYGPKLYVPSQNEAKVEWRVSKLVAEDSLSYNYFEVAFVIVGELMVEPEVNGVLFLVEPEGVTFWTSKIKKIDNVGEFRIIHTQNSKYKLEKL